jgi:RNA polymerase sigma factor (sigma-70 family)
MEQREAAAGLSFEEVYRRHADAVYRFCLSQLRDAAAAEDLAADVFAAGFANYPTARPDENGVRAWLFRIARNGAIDHYRKARTQKRWLRTQGLDADHHDVERTVELNADLRSALAAIGLLRKRDRLLVGLRIAGGLSYAEVGAVAGMSENAARMATNRALDKVRHQMEAGYD